MTSPARGLRLRVLVPLSAAILTVVLVFVGMFASQNRRQRDEDIQRSAALIDDLIHAESAQGVQLMRSVMDLMMRDDRLADALARRDRRDLLVLSQPILEDLRLRNRVTHFYFILPDRTMLLRVQLPDQWGDRIDRFVLQEAQRTGKPFWGNEQGPFGSLTLRVTSPWLRANEVIGYLELGIEFEDIVAEVHRMADADVFVAIEKRYLDRAKWDRMQKKLGRHADWDEFPNVIVLSRTREQIPAPIAAYLRASHTRYPREAFEVHWDDRVEQAVILPFLDLRGRELGAIVALRDVTAAAAEVRRGLWTVIGMCVLVASALFGFFYVLLGRVQIDVGNRTVDLRTSNERLALEILERKRAEQVLEQRTRALARSNAELEQLVSVAWHDLQEPLRAVGSHLQLLERRYKHKLDPEADEFIRFAVDGARRMKALIVDLLAYLRVGSQGGGFRTTDCETVLAAALRDLAGPIEQTGARITHDPLPRVNGSPGELVDLFQNLIANAIKFRGEEAPEIHIHAEPTPWPLPEDVGHPRAPAATAQNAAWWCFSVRDNGIGIAPEHFDRIFVLFQRLHREVEISGTGIGLAICKKIVERHGGRIWVRSIAGAGATFFFTLPRAEAPHPEAAHPPA
jgi:signal transduction histidine kinase